MYVPNFHQLSKSVFYSEYLVRVAFPLSEQICIQLFLGGVFSKPMNAEGGGGARGFFLRILLRISLSPPSLFHTHSHGPCKEVALLLTVAVVGFNSLSWNSY